MPFTSEQAPLKFSYIALLIFVIVIFIAFFSFHHPKQVIKKPLIDNASAQQITSQIKNNSKISLPINNAKLLQQKPAINLAPDATIINAAQTAKLRQLLSSGSNANYPILPLPHSLSAPQQQISTSVSITVQRCTYNNQSYVAGDIVKVDQDWMRCTPTILFTPDDPGKPQIGNPTWTKVQ